MDDLIAEFLTETRESLDELDADLVRFEQSPNDKDLLSKIFRIMHTIKGTCGFLGLPRLETVAHRAENVLGKFRDGELEVTPAYVTLIFESIDRIKMIVEALEESGAEPEGSDEALIEKLDAVYEGRDGGGEAGGEPAAAPATQEGVPAQEPKADIEVTQTLERELKPGEVPLEELERIFQETEALPPEPVAKKEEPKKEEDKPVATQAAAPAQSLRVNVDVLEDLMTMVSELVLNRNQLLQILRTQQDSPFSAPLQRLNHVVSDLQEGVMKTRMQPIGNAWSKLPRIIRDISMELNKKIDLVMEGQETELDRQVLEMIKDPLTHMVRNSADHGIEAPEDRIQLGKPETGKIILRAYHEGGHIIIEISDDGKGLPLDKIKAKILKNGLATEDELETMSTQQIQQFIFKAGFSTAEQVTSVSGRGVGMDVVRTNIENIGGAVELKSVEGEGSVFTIRIPLTLAIVSALIVESGGERFAIPQLAVRELVMVSENSDHQIENIKGVPVFRLRDHLLPLVSLSELLKLQDQNFADVKEAVETELKDNGDIAAAPQTGEPSNVIQLVQQQANNTYIVVAQVGTYVFGIIVDKVFDTEEIVVKPVANILRDIDLFSGNTILGDGSVIMILDPTGIARATGELETSSDSTEAQDEEYHAQGKTSLLLFSAGDSAPKAVPLSLISRLEEIETDKIERTGDRMVIQYREKLMPLMPFNSNVSVDEKTKPVLVLADSDQMLGIIVDNIVDIREERIDVQIQGGSEGIIGSAIISGQATEVIDVGYYMETMQNNWFEKSQTPYSERKTGKTRSLLLVDDSPFFRNMLTPLLSVAGYEVTTAETPVEALAMQEEGLEFDVIISDIEMPEMSGYEFVEKVKESKNWCDTPIFALSAHATKNDKQRGIQAGFNDYVAKFDRDNLLKALSETFVDDQDDEDASSAEEVA